MSFWPFGQGASSASSLNALLDAYNRKRRLQVADTDAEEPERQHQHQYQHQRDKSVDKPVDKPPEDVVVDRDFVYTVLDDQSILSELNRQNNKLIDFVCFGYIDDGQGQGTGAGTGGADDDTATPVLDILISLVVDSLRWFEDNERYFQHQEELEENEQIAKVANRIHVASEILSCKIWLISETLVEETSLLSKLWTFLDCTFMSSSPSIQFFVKINEQLLESRPDQMLNFIRSQPLLVDRFIRHVDITIVMDFLLRIITTDKPDIPTGIIEILHEQQLVSKLLDLLETEKDTSTQSSCGDFLKALISISANTSIDENTIGPNLLTRELISDLCIDQIIRIIMKRGNGLSTVVGVVIEIIRKNNSDYDPFNILYTSVESHPPSTRDPVFLGKMLCKFAENLTVFNYILTDPKLTSKRVETQINKEIEPLGFERFKICELVAELLHCSNIQLLNNQLAPKVIAERERLLLDQETNLANALNNEISQSPQQPKGQTSLTLSNLNIGTSEPVVAVNDNNITISPHSTPAMAHTEHSGELPLADLSESMESPPSKVLSKREEIAENPTVGDLFKIQLIESNILTTIIGMFIKYPWNNFWHNVVFDVVQQIFNGRLDMGFNQFLILELFATCDITNLIIDAYMLCHDTEVKTNVRLGYMGHLVLIAEEVVKFSSVFQNSKFNDSEIDELIYSRLVDDHWVSYVTNVLSETREQYNCVLGGINSEDFQQSEYLNPNAIILGNSEEEIMNQDVSHEHIDQDLDIFYEATSDEFETKTDDDDDNDQPMTNV